jgi:sugar phosphate isomerase/epimerase
MEKIKYGLKLWSNNSELFPEAVKAFKRGEIDFVELYSNPDSLLDTDALRTLLELPVTIHATHSHGFHEFVIKEEQVAIWKQTLQLADFFESDVIVVHPGQAHTIESFQENLAKIDDSRIHIENMSGLDIDRNPMFGQNLSDLEEICRIKPICFDLEKAVKAACYQKVDYKEYILAALHRLRPQYFHISGGTTTHSVDEHTDLKDADFDIQWMKRGLENIGEVRLVFETPKRTGIDNDLRNMAFFGNL